MERHAGPLAALWWIVRDAATGTIEVHGPGGETVDSALAPGAAELFAEGAPASTAVRLHLADRTETVLDAARVPGVPGVAVATASGSAGDALGPIVETIVNQVAHDVRNFAFTIGLQAELGDRRADAQPEVKGHFASVLRQVEALKTYLDKLLLYGRPVALRPAAVDPGALVRQQVQTLQFGWRPDAPPVAVSVRVAPDAGEVRWDPRCIGFAVLALLDNAARSADPAPPITVEVSREGGAVTIAVIDSGPGIPPDKLAHLWSPMRVRRHGGTGLGLATARKMVQAHGGTLDLETGPSGTRVLLRLPVEVGAG